MTDHKTVREAFEKEWPNWDKYPSGNYMDEIVQTAWGNFQAGYAAALDRIEAVETVTVEDVIRTVMKGCHGTLNPKHVRWAVDALSERYPNGLRITKEK